MSDGGAGQRRRRHLATIAAVVALGAVVLVVGMVEEPYHIDELRQVGYYDRPLAGVIDGSIAQDQPPLDAIIGSLTQRVVGVGDIRQRLHPVVFGVANLILLAILLWRAGLRVGAVAGVALFSLAPLVVSHTAYARPYAVPTFLALGFLLATDAWLRNGRWWAAVLAALAAAALPLSRAVEPVILLTVAAGTIAVIGIRRRLPRIRWAIAAGIPALAVAAVGIPMTLALSGEVAEFAGLEGQAPGAGLARLLTDLPDALAASFPAPLLALGIVLLAASVPAIRGRILTTWWAWPLAGTATGFAVAFMVTARPSQVFYDRYTYAWWPIFAVIAAFTVEWAVTTPRSPLRMATAAAVAGMIVVVAASLVVDLGRDDWGDYEPLARLIDQEAPSDAVVVFDNIRPLTAYRPGFAGHRRYGTHDITLASAVIAHPERVPEDAPALLALNAGPARGPADRMIEASRDMMLYFPEPPVRGRQELATMLIAYGRRFEPDQGAMLRLAGAALLAVDGDHRGACAEVAGLLAEAPDLAGAVEDRIATTVLGDTVAGCAGASG